MAHLSGVNSQCTAHEAMKPTIWRMAAILHLPFPFSFSHMKPTPTAHTSSSAPSQKLALTLHPMLHKLAHMSLYAEQPGVNCPPIRSYLTKPTTWQGSNLTPSPSHSATWNQHLQPILQASVHSTPPPPPPPPPPLTPSTSSTPSSSQHSQLTTRSLESSQGISSHQLQACILQLSTNLHSLLSPILLFAKLVPRHLC